MQLLSDPFNIGLRYPEYCIRQREVSPDDGRICSTVSFGLVRSADDLDKAADIVSTTTWEAVDRNTFAEEQKQLIELLGLSEEVSIETNDDKETFGPVIDELDSYEHLVKEAGDK